MKKWVRCPKCGHKLFFADVDSVVDIEIKCHSCKDVVNVLVVDKHIKTLVMEEHDGGKKNRSCREKC